MNEHGALFNIAKSNVTDQIKQLVNDFPLKNPDSVPVGGLVDTSSDDDTDEAVLYARSTAVYTAVYKSILQALIDMFDDGDLSSWPTSLTNGSYVHELTNFFDGRFMYQLQGLDET
ncbi:hypothetical protein N7520_006278 [Penicillium odoratum]|uniref:uncharacterized protein n=1 Tax=Penicillium odoratum TaxID=1167516 RepID=UPI002549B5B0|nr:uncharacterized protein N7520_006278 [Penicillium odoratum]KAJ5759122.1 hypothetical protein N7520_006278 [Penicillium odoratum]